MVISSPFLAHLSDRIGPSKTLFISSGVASISILLFSTAKSLLLYYISALLIGMAFVGVTVLVLPIIINLWFDKKNRGFALSLAFMGSGVGGLLLNPLFAEMIASFGWRCAYGLWGAFFLTIFTPFTFIIFIYLPWKKDYSPLVTGVHEMSPLDNPERKDTPMKYRKIISAICIASFMISGLGISVMMHGNSYLVSLGKTPAEASFIIGISLGIVAFSKLMVGKSCDRFGCKDTLIIFLTLAAIGTLAFYLCEFSAIGYMAFIIFFGLGGASFTVCPPLVVRELFSHERYSKELGKVMASVGLGNMGMPIIAGVIHDITGNYSAFWIGGCVVLLIAMGLFSLGFRWGKS